MFGIGFTELLMIAVIAIIFLGPDKLPQAMVDIAKFIKNIKQTLGEARHSLEEEMKIADLKDEALSYKKQLTDASDELRGFKNITLNDELTPAQRHRQKIEAEAKQQVQTMNQEPIATPVEPKKEHMTIKKRPLKDPYAIADTTPKSAEPTKATDENA